MFIAFFSTVFHPEHIGFASSHADKEMLTILLQDKTLKEVFSYIEKHSSYIFIYEEAVNLEKKVSVNFSAKPVDEIIKEVFSANGLSYTIKGRQIIIKTKNEHQPSVPATAQTTLTVRGNVKDHTGTPLAGVNVILKGTTRGTITDIDGNFELSDIAKGAIIQFAYIGYKSQEVGAQEKMSIVLNEDNELLDEVVVVGYGTQKKVNMTGAVSSVKSDALENRPMNNATNALAGLAAGLSVTNTGGSTPGWESPTIRIRGQGTLNNSDPLVVIDGMTGGSISDINPQDIESISILKDAASSSIYGSRAANGSS